MVTNANQPNKRKYLIHLGSIIGEPLDELAKDKMLDLTSYVRMILKEYLDKHDRKR